MIAVVILAAVFATGEALECHQCTSYIHTQCGDPFFADADGQPKANEEFLQDCGDAKYTLCRKIYQNVRGDERIIRSCGYEEYFNSAGDPKDEYTTVLEEYNTYVTTCSTDGCNSSTTFRVSMISVLMAVVLAAVFK